MNTTVQDVMRGSGPVFKNLLRGANKWIALVWFLLGFAIYITVLYFASNFAAAYVNRAVAPMINDLMREVGYIFEEDPSISYNPETLKRYLDALIQEMEIAEKKLPEIEREIQHLEARRTSLIDAGEADGLAVKELERLQQEKEREKTYLLDAIVRQKDTIGRLRERMTLLQKDVRTLLEDKALWPRKFPAKVAYLTERFAALTKQHLGGTEAQAFAVVHRAGFFSGGLVVNQVFVSHWLWYIPMIVSVLYLLADIFQRRPTAPGMVGGGSDANRRAQEAMGASSSDADA